MKKLINICLALSIAFTMTACGATVERESKDETSMFVCVENSILWKIVYHKKTKVMYAVSDSSYNYGNFTLLVNADGTPMIWED